MSKVLPLESEARLFCLCSIKFSAVIGSSKASKRLAEPGVGVSDIDESMTTSGVASDETPVMKPLPRADEPELSCVCFTLDALLASSPNSFAHPFKNQFFFVVKASNAAIVEFLENLIRSRVFFLLSLKLILSSGFLFFR